MDIPSLCRSCLSALFCTCCITLCPISPAWVAILLPPLITYAVSRASNPFVPPPSCLWSIIAGSFLVPLCPAMNMTYDTGWYTFERLRRAVGFVRRVRAVRCSVVLLARRGHRVVTHCRSDRKGVAKAPLRRCIHSVLMTSQPEVQPRLACHRGLQRGAACSDALLGSAVRKGGLMRGSNGNCRIA